MSYIDRLHVAEHEAAHTIAAMKMGLPVSWVTIDPGHDEGTDFAAAVKIPEGEIDYERDMLAIAVAMAAPSHLTHHTDFFIGRYADIEAKAAYRAAVARGIEFEEVYDLSGQIVADEWEAIGDLAQRLMEEGTVTLDVQRGSAFAPPRCPDRKESTAAPS